MLQPFLELVVNAADTAVTVVVLLALWEGRRAGARIRRFLGIRDAQGETDVDRFLSDARRTRSSGPAPPAPPPALPLNERSASRDGSNPV